MALLRIRKFPDPVLKAGEVLVAGLKGKVLTSGTLSRAFQAPIRLRHKRGRYSLVVTPSVSVVI